MAGHFRLKFSSHIKNLLFMLPIRVVFVGAVRQYLRRRLNMNMERVDVLCFYGLRLIAIEAMVINWLKICRL